MLKVNAVGKSFFLKRDKNKNASGKDPREQHDKFHALREVDFTLEKGKTLGLLGANGAGKTTLMRILATSLKPTTGTVNLLGFDIVKKPDEVRKKVGFLSGSTGLYNRLNAHELLTYFGRLYGLSRDQIKERIQSLFDELEIHDFGHRRIDNLSAGMKQRVAIARSLVHSPEFIIFDEPTTGLDVPTAQIILNYIERCREAGNSVIFSTHHMHEVEKLCDQVVLIHQGSICFDGTVDEMKQHTGYTHLDDAYLAITGEGKSKMASRPESGPVKYPTAGLSYVK